MRINRAILALLIGLPTAGCGSGMKVATDFDPGANFSRLETYAWIAAGGAEAGARRMIRPESERRVIAAVDRELEARGYRAVAGDPDFKIGFFAVAADEIDEQVVYTDRHLGYVSSETQVSVFQKGTLVLFITDPGEEKVLWQSTASETFQDPSQETINKRIDEAVGKMLSKFPPGG
jgi:hypothetical protein